MTHAKIHVPAAPLLPSACAANAPMLSFLEEHNSISEANPFPSCIPDAAAAAVGPTNVPPSNNNAFETNCSFLEDNTGARNFVPEKY